MRPAATATATLPLLTVLILAAPAAASGPSRLVRFHDLHRNAPDRQVVRVHAPADRLAALGFDLARHGSEDPGTPVDVVTTASDRRQLEQAGFSYTPVRFGEEDPGLSGWSDHEAIMARVKALVEANPDLMSLRSPGTSVEGRELVTVRISDDPGAAHPERPQVSFNAAHHCREVMTVEVALDILGQLAARYREGDAAAVRWLSQLEIHVTPVVNPDGYRYVFSDDTWWRKNRRDNGGGSFGVDLNRNYPYAWGANDSGSSSRPWSETYRGTGPTSEPEARAMVDLARSIHPVFNISFHSYGEVLLYPYGYEGAGNPEGDLMEDIATELASRMVTDTGDETYGKRSRLYPVNGLDRDWYYFELGTYSFVAEISSPSRGFHPTHDWVEPTVTGLRDGWTWILDRALGPGIRGRVTDAVTGEPVVARVTVEGVTWVNGESRATSAEGWFQRVLRPGPRSLHVEAAGYEPARVEVTVEENDLTSHDVVLTPRSAGTGVPAAR